jgi:hypothetical protein
MSIYLKCILLKWYSLGVHVHYIGFEAFVVTMQWSLRWSAVQKMELLSFWRHTLPASSRFDLMSVTAVCCTYAQCCQSLVSCLSAELCACLSKLHWRPQVVCHAECLMSIKFPFMMVGILSITVMQQLTIKYVCWFVGYAELAGNHITYLWQLYACSILGQSLNIFLFFPWSLNCNRYTRVHI